MKKKVLIIVAIVLAVLIGLSIWAIVHSQDITKFPQNTAINGVDCSGLDAEEATDKLTEAWNNKEFKIVWKEKTIDTIDGFNFTYDIEDQVEEAMNPNFLKKIVIYYGLLKNKAEIEMTVDKATSAFKKQVKKLYLPRGEKKKDTKNAHVDLSNTKFEIIPEVYGNTIDRKKIQSTILSDIEQSVFELDYVPKEFYKKPTILSDDPRLKTRQEYCKKYLTTKVRYDLIYTTIRIKPADLDKMIKANKKGKIKVRSAAVSTYIANLAATARNAYSENRGISGMELKQELETYKLSAALRTGQDTTVYAEYTYPGGGLSLGGDYVEIDLSQQTLWLSIGGNNILTTPIVSGNVSKGDATPVGTFLLDRKARNATLKGENYDGTDYESPVKYWMPFNGGIGMHDAPWKKTYGGTEYLRNGSHGCINMKEAAAATAYANVYPGIKVLVHE